MLISFISIYCIATRKLCYRSSFVDSSTIVFPVSKLCSLLSLTSLGLILTVYIILATSSFALIVTLREEAIVTLRGKAGMSACALIVTLLAAAGERAGALTGTGTSSYEFPLFVTLGVSPPTPKFWTPVSTPSENPTFKFYFEFCSSELALSVSEPSIEEVDSLDSCVFSSCRIC